MLQDNQQMNNAPYQLLLSIVSALSQNDIA